MYIHESQCVPLEVSVTSTAHTCVAFAPTLLPGFVSAIASALASLSFPRFPRLCEFYNFENFTREFRNSFASSKLLSNATEDSLTRHLKLSAVDFAALSKHPSRDNIREL